MRFIYDELILHTLRFYVLFFLITILIIFIFHCHHSFYMLKLLFDKLISLFALIVLSPIFIFITIIIFFDSRGKIFYRQIRVGKDGKDFLLFKFRTMRPNSDAKGLLTIGENDSRVTRIGYYLREYKLDELPQLLNVFIGDMSIVGPRPEVRRYVDMYNETQRKVLSVRPGITDYASIKYIEEGKFLNKAKYPEQFYINELMPAKLELNLKYIRERNFFTDLNILIETFFKIF